MEAFKMVPGARYKIRYRRPGQRYDREAVLAFLARVPGAYYFSGRARWRGEKEACGNFNLPGSWIRSIDPVPASTSQYYDRRAPAATTVTCQVMVQAGEGRPFRFTTTLENVPVDASRLDNVKTALEQIAEDIGTGRLR